VSLLEDYDRGELRRHAVRADRRLLRAILAARRRLAALLRPASSFIDFRVRKSIVLMSEKLGSEIELDEVARDAGLSRPHFYKLFRRQTGVTAEIYLNTRAWSAPSADRPDRPIDHRDRLDELGFSCQSVFTRFFSSHVGHGATDYRRAVQVLNG
jgi:AraC-like DNA-binding protein